jgi:hypothetical protein
MAAALGWQRGCCGWAVLGVRLVQFGRRRAAIFDDEDDLGGAPVVGRNQQPWPAAAGSPSQASVVAVYASNLAGSYW